MKNPLLLTRILGVLLAVSLLFNVVFLMNNMELFVMGHKNAVLTDQYKVEERSVVDPWEIVEDELRKLSPGLILFNVPQEMKVGIEERVEVRMTKTITEDLSKGLKGRGLPQIEEIRVNTFMGVRLKDDNNFDIKERSHEKQIVAGEGFTQWDWDVTPLKSGIKSLLLTVTVRIRIPNYGEEEKDYLVFERKINVKVNPSYTIKKFIESYWQWLTTAILIPLTGWFVNKLWKSRKKKK